MLQVIASGHLSGDGAFTRRCQELLESELGVPRVFLTTSCTHALELCALLLDLLPGDEVIIPSFTFVSTVNAFVLRGARPVFADVRSDTLNLDERLIEERISPLTRAVVPVHYAGIACQMDRILQIAQEHDLAVIEDNAHGLFGSLNGRLLGTFGSLATQSFHDTKNFTCGEGGALLVNENALVQRAEIIREKGTNRSRFFRGEIDKYTWVDVGSSYLPSDLLAGFLLAQLEDRHAIQQARKAVFERYHRELALWAEQNGVQLPTIPPGCIPAYHIFFMLLPSPELRQRFIEHLRRRGIQSVFHYQPLHLSDMGRSFGGRPGDCPVTESIADRLVRLPFYNTLSPLEQDEVISAVLEFHA
jgi:dTDP-4-amino-4,6-dideoxygalactose transaminase